MSWDDILERLKIFSKKGVKTVSKDASEVKEKLSEIKQEKQYSDLNKYEISMIKNTINDLNSTLKDIENKEFNSAVSHLNNAAKDFENINEQFIFLMNETDQFYKKTQDKRAIVFLDKLKEYDAKREEFVQVIKEITNNLQKNEDLDKIKEFLERITSGLEYELTLFNGFVKVRDGILKNELMIQK